MPATTYTLNSTKTFANIFGSHSGNQPTSQGGAQSAPPDEVVYVQGALKRTAKAATSAGQTEQARLFLQGLRFRPETKKGFGGRVQDEAVDRVQSLINYYPVLKAAKAFAAIEDFAAGVAAFLPSLSLPSDLRSLLEETVPVRKRWPATESKSTPSTCVSVASSPCGTRSFRGQELMRRISIKDPVIFEVNDVCLELMVARAGALGEFDEKYPGGDAAWRLGHARAWAHSTALELENISPDRAIEYLNAHHEQLRGIDGGADAAASLLLQSGYADIKGLKLSNGVTLTSDPWFGPAWAKAERVLLGFQAPLVEQKKVNTLPSLTGADPAFQKNAEVRASALATAINAINTDGVLSLLRGLIKARIEARLEPVELASLPPETSSKLIAAAVGSGHLGVSSVLGGLLFKDGSDGIAAALEGLNFAPHQREIARQFAKNLSQVHVTDLLKLIPQFENLTVDFPLIAVRSYLLSTKRPQDLDAKELSSWLRLNPESTLQALLDHARDYSREEQKAFVGLLSELYASEDELAPAIQSALCNGAYRCLLPDLADKIDDAALQIDAENGVEKLAHVIKTEAGLVSATELVRDALKQKHTIDTLHIAPLADADKQLGGVPGKRITASAAQQAPTVDIFGTSLPVNTNPQRDLSAVPGRSADLVMTPTTRENLRLVAALMAAGKPVLISGPTSAGKTSAITYLAMRTSTPLRRINLSFHTSVSDLVGKYVGGEARYSVEDLLAMSDEGVAKTAAGYGLSPLLPRDEQVKQVLAVQDDAHWVDGLVVRAARNGEFLILDEINLARSEVLERLNSLFDSTGCLMLSECGGAERVKPKPGFRIFATMNPSTYAGRGELSESFRSRWTELHFKGLTQSDMFSFVTVRYPSIPKTEVSKLVTFHMRVSNEADSGRLARALGGVAFSLRNIDRVCERFNKYHGRGLSDDKLMSREVYEIYAGGLTTPADVTLLRDIMRIAVPNGGSSFYDDLDVKETDTEVSIGDVTLQKSRSDHAFVPQLNARLVSTPRTLEILYRIVKAIDCDENILLVGEKASGKTAMIEMMALLLQQPFFRQQVAANTSPMQLVGGYDQRGWHDGLLLQAIHTGGAYLLDEVNFANSALLERLNPLLERPRRMVVTEKEGDEVRVSPQFRFFGAMNPPTLAYGGRNKLSLAFSNRMTTIAVPEMPNSELLAVAVAHAATVGVPKPVAEALVNLQDWVAKAYVSGKLGESSSKSARPVLSVRQLKNAIDLVASHRDARGDIDAFLIASEIAYGATANQSDNTRVQNKARELSE